MLLAVTAPLLRNTNRHKNTNSDRLVIYVHYTKAKKEGTRGTYSRVATKIFEDFDAFQPALPLKERFFLLKLAS